MNVTTVRCRRGLVGRRVRPQRGFTLIETALAIVIVGVGVLAMMSAQQAYHHQNSWSTHTSIGTRLGHEIREMTLNLPRHDPVTGASYWGPEENELGLDDFDDLDDFDGDGTGLVFSSELENGPINAMRVVIPGMDGWSQTVRVFNINPFDINSELNDGASDMVMIEVIVSYQAPSALESEEVTRVSWIAPN